MAYKKGESGNPGGRPKGSQNTLTKTVKETVLTVFNELQSEKTVNLKAFAKKYPRDFYQIAAKLIPTEIQAKVSKIQVEIVRTNPAQAEHPSPGTVQGAE